MRREKFLEELAKVAEENNKGDLEKSIKEIGKRERKNREFGYLKNILKPRSEDVIPEVEIPKGETSVPQMWKRLKDNREDPEEWEKFQEETK